MHHDSREGHGQGRLSFFLQQQLADRAKTTFLQLHALLRNASLYPPAHPFLLGSAEQLLLGLDELFSKRAEASYHFISGELYFETISVAIEENISRTVEDIVRKGIGGITFLPGVKRDELVSLAYLMNRDTLKKTGKEAMDTLLASAGVKHITFHAVHAGDTPEDRFRNADKKPSEIYLEGVTAVKEFTRAAQLGKGLNPRKLHGIITTMVDSISENPDALIGLTSIKLYDEYTFAHSVNVAILSIALGYFLSFDRPQIATLGIAGMLHDIGKVAIPLDIINKRGALNDREWELVKRHPAEGALILAGLPGVSRLAMVATFEHHRQYDLKGYPSAGEDRSPIHPFSKIVSIADAYDALTSTRVYFDIQRPPDEAISILLNRRGTMFDPVLLKTFVNMVGIFPIGTLLRLDTGEAGLVVRQTRDLLRPRVRLLTTFDGSEKEEVSLLEMAGGRYKRSSVATMDPNIMKVNVSQYFL